MKKAAVITAKSLAGLVLLILVLLFTIPVLFKEKIRTKVENVINESVNAKVTFGDYKIGFFRNFPNLSFSLKNLYVSGLDQFEGDTLAGLKSFDLVFNLGSLFGKSGYEIKSIVIDQAVVNAIVLKDGKANWDISKPSETVAVDTTAGMEVPAGESTMKVLLRKFEIRNSNILYMDSTMNLNARLNSINFILSGNMALSETNLSMKLDADETSVVMGGIKYINRAIVDSKIDLIANLDSMRFVFGENYFGINDLKLNFSGSFTMPGDDIRTDLTFGTEQTSFKTLLSLIPAVYMTGYEGLNATGEFKLSGSAKGVYSEADSTLPDIDLNLSVNNGLISYPDLPEKISNIIINTDVFVNGEDLDKTTVNMDKFHFELAGSPFDMSFSVKTPMSDPDFKGSMIGKIDLAALSKAIPMDSMSLSGVIDMAVSLAGRLSMIEKEQYDKFSATGTMKISNMMLSMSGYPDVSISGASFLFTPAYAQMQRADITVAGTSDFSISGNLENYIPYVFRDETIRGNLNLSSKMIDMTSIMNSLTADTTSVEPEDTTALAVIAVPRNIDFDFNAAIGKFTYDNIKAENLKGHIIVRDGILSVRETGMNILGGSVSMNADYDTRDTLKPFMKADFDMTDVGVKDAYNMFVTVQKFAPTAKGIDGRINMQLAYQSLLGSDMMPVLMTISGSGKIHSDEVQLVESATFEKFKQVLKLGDKYSNTFKDINVSFKINEGRIYVSPFDVKVGNVKMNISGDQGLDQTINYLIRTQIPRSDLGSSVNALIEGISSQASVFGIKYKPADIIKVNVRVSGTFTKPVVTPEFGGSSGGEGGTTVKETAGEAVRQAVDNTVDKTKDQLRQEAEAQGDRLIKEAEDKGQKLRDEAAKAAQRIRQEADSSAAKLIQGAESKGVIAKAAARKGADALKNEADKRANQLILEADNQAKRLVEEAQARKEELVKKI